MAYNSLAMRFGSKAWRHDKTYMTFGNKKMSIPLFNLPAKSTCPGSTEYCRKYCYALKSEQLFPSVKAKRENNLALTKSPDFVETLSKEIASVTFIKYVRIHESGDFYSQEYLNNWFKICKKFPEKTFLAFTKCFHLDFSKKPKNLNLYFSVWADTDTSKIKNKRIKRAITVIDYKWAIAKGIDKAVDISKAVPCNGHCDKCLVCFENKSSVFFHIH
jgi:hypothetical protein